MVNGAFDPLRAMRVLVAHGVQFVLIGGIAGRVWGSPTVTNDLDICYSTDQANLGALAAALQEMDARLRRVAEEVPFLLDALTLAEGGSFTFVTTAGNLDVLAVPAGTDGYDDLARTAVVLDLGDLEVPVAHMEDLIRMKRAAGRPKDRIELEVLGALREEMDGGSP